MRTILTRRFTLADGMILIAAAALGLGLQNTLLTAGIPPWMKQYGMLLTPWLIATPIGLLGLRAMHPRPTLRRICRQPGTVACAASLAAISMRGLLNAIDDVIYQVMGSHNVHGLSHWIWDYYAEALVAGGWVALAWAVLASARAWRSEPSWIDRAGRVYGWLMIAIWFLASIHP
jgi:hypothetical protein